MWQDDIENLGFAILPEVLRRDEVDVVLREMRQCSLPRSRAGIRHLLNNRTVWAIASDERLTTIAQGILGPTAVPFHATLFDKSPDANWLVVWHQDTALPLLERIEGSGWGPWSTKQGITYAHAPASALEKVLALRIHLDDSTVDNGPLRVLPATHRLGVLSDDSIEEIALRMPATDCIASRGGIVAMRPLVVHASSKSQSAVPRRVVHIEYAASMMIAEGMKLARA